MRFAAWMPTAVASLSLASTVPRVRANGTKVVGALVEFTGWLEPAWRWQQSASALCTGSLAIGMALDVIVIVRNLSESPAVAVVTGATAGIGFLVAWYVVPLWARRRHRPRQGENYARAA